jgi:hypothetical protein
VKYCPGPSCPHRSRVHQAAEFLDTIAVCSDCGAELVSERDLASAEIALATQGVAGASGIYRQARRGGLKRRANPSDPEHARRVARASLVGGIVLMGMGCALISLTGGRQSVLLVGPILYAAYRFTRDHFDGPSKAKKGAGKEVILEPTSYKPARAE